MLLKKLFRMEKMSESINTESVNTEAKYGATADSLNTNKTASNETTLVSQTSRDDFVSFSPVRLDWYFNERLLNFHQYFTLVTDYIFCQVCV